MTEQQVSDSIKARIKSIKKDVNIPDSFKINKISAFQFMLNCNLLTKRKLKKKFLALNKNYRNCRYGYWRAFADMVEYIDKIDKANIKSFKHYVKQGYIKRG